MNSFTPGYIQFGVCTPDERKQKGMVYNAAKTWWATLRAELPEEVANQTATEPRRMGNLLSSVRVAILPE